MEIQSMFYKVYGYRLGTATQLNMEPILLKNKFRGTMLGVLIGDCLGSPYEGLTNMSSRKKILLQQWLDKLWDTEFRG